MTKRSLETTTVDFGFGTPADFTLTVNEVDIKVHRCILAHFSHVVRALVQENSTVSSYAIPYNETFDENDMVYVVGNMYQTDNYMSYEPIARAITACHYLQCPAIEEIMWWIMRSTFEECPHIQPGNNHTLFQKPLYSINIADVTECPRLPGKEPTSKHLISLKRAAELLQLCCKNKQFGVAEIILAKMVRGLQSNFRNDGFAKEVTGSAMVVAGVLVAHTDYMKCTADVHETLLRAMNIDQQTAAVSSLLVTADMWIDLRNLKFK